MRYMTLAEQRILRRALHRSTRPVEDVMANSRQQPDEPRHHGRMSPDEMEAAIRDLQARLAQIERTGTAGTQAGATPFVTGQAVTAVGDNAPLDLNRTKVTPP
jgi:hypothetical protein